jgi:hypothetical protein
MRHPKTWNELLDAGYVFELSEEQVAVARDRLGVEAEEKMRAMQENKHTPGPWKVSQHTTFKDGKLVEYPVVYPNGDYSKDKPLCRVFDGFESIDGQANAILIAAAPELLEKLEYAMGLLKEANDLHGFRNAVFVREMEKLIQKARGEK